MKKLIIATALTAIVSSPAMAWGDKEQGALAGVIGTLFLQHMYNNNQSAPRPQHYPNNGGYQQNNGYGYYGQPTCQRGYNTRVIRQGNMRIEEKIDICTGRVLERIEYYNYR